MAKNGAGTWEQLKFSTVKMGTLLLVQSKHIFIFQQERGDVGCFSKGTREFVFRWRVRGKKDRHSNSLFWHIINMKM